MGEIKVRVQPRASRSEIAGWRGDALVVRVSSPPVDDRANKELIKLIAKAAGVAKSHVSIVRGTRSRDKVVRVEGVDPKQLRAALRR
ncbi:MAG: DUF167 domain-containing protein [Solirubrobacterales bacterium]